MQSQTIIMLVLGGGVALAAILMINALVGRKNRVSYAFASIDAMLKMRFDLIPNLVSTVERYMKHEREVLEELTRWRSQAASGTLTSDALVSLDNQVSQAMRTLFAQAENYPQLMASDNFLQLQGSLNEVEAQVAASRRAYNAAVTDYNNGCEMFPFNILATMLGYKVKCWFEIPDNERQSINVKEMWS
jgi:LemA protein